MYSVKPFSSLYELTKAFPTEQSCIDHLEWIRWKGNVTSPLMEGSTVYKCAGNKYRCKDTGKYFNVRTGTIFENTKVSLRDWFLGIYLFSSHKKGISSYQFANDVGVTQKTAWFMLHRIRYAMEHKNFINHMDGIVQVDETFNGGKNKNRHWDKKVKNNQGRSFKDKTPILGMLSDGKVKAVAIPDTSGNTIVPILTDNIPFGSTIISDEWTAYNSLHKTYHHEVVYHNRGQYVNEAGFTTNAIEGFWSHLKRGIIGIYHKVSRKHLQQYANEYTFRYNSRKESTSERINLFLGSTIGSRLTYKSLINAKGC